MIDQTKNAVMSGLDGVIAAQTRLSMVDGARGELRIGGYPVEQLAAHASFEDALALLWDGDLPDATRREALRASLAARRHLTADAEQVIRSAIARNAAPMDALRAAAGTIAPTGDDATDALAVIAALPVLVAADIRLRRGLPLVAPDPTLGHAANLLWMATGAPPSPAAVRALDTYLVTVIDHGFNASTFAARVIVSTGSDIISAVVGAIGALKGPLHGGAPGPALETVFEIGSTARAQSILKGKLERGERLMGFGHRIYKVRDPRAEVLSQAAAAMFRGGADAQLYELACAVERTALRLLAEAKPGLSLQTHVEFFTALILHGLGFTPEEFSPIFAIGRSGGWTAHAFEQRAAKRLIRPQSAYVGPVRELAAE